MNVLKQSTATILKLGPFLDDTDGKTAETGLTIGQSDIQISKNGGAYAQTSEGSPTTTHDADGCYPIPLTTTDTGTLGHIKVKVFVSGALPEIWEGTVVPANVYDSLVLGTDSLEADAVAISGDSTAADNLEAILDGNGITGDVDITMRSLTITNDAGVGMAVTGTTDGLAVEGTAGSGIKASSSGSNGDGLELVGNGTGNGLDATGGATGDGAVLEGGTNGYGLNVAAHGDYAGVRIAGSGSGNGVHIAPGATGVGAYISGGSSSGAAAQLITPGSSSYGLIVTPSSNMNAVHLMGQGTGHGLFAGSSGTGNGIKGQGGTYGGAGIKGEAVANNDAGMELVAHGTGDDLAADNLSELDAAGLRTAVGLASANLDTQLSTAQSDLDTLTGSDGATLATTQGNYAPAKAGDAMALTSGERTTLAGVIWATLTSALTTVGSVGKLVVDYLDAAITSRSDGTLVTLHGDYDAAKTAAPAGAEMDLVDAPNSTAIAAIITALVANDQWLDIVAAVRGNVDKVGDAYTFYADDDTTPRYTITYTASDRTRS